MPVFAFIKDCLSLVTTALLLLCGLFLCVRLRAFALLHPARVLKVAFKGEKNRKETVKAFTLALAGTLGVGNIAGVALAIFYGGAGALFWMWVCGIFAMFLKYAEISLALADKAEGGNGFGYIARAFGGKKAPLALFAFAMLALSFSMGAMIQSNAIASTASANLSISPILTGVLLFLLTFAVIFGGLNRISSVTLRLIPLASALYVAMCLLVLFCRFDAIGVSFARIFASAFESRAGVFGVLGFLFSRAFRQGGMCGLLSNEAGCGTAPLAHATASGAAPAKQAVWGIFEVFADTMILCTLTGLTLLVSMDKVPMGAKGMEAVCAVFSSFFGAAGGALLLFCVCLFAFATILCWSFYGVRALSFFTQNEKSRKRYLLAFCLCAGLGALFAPSFVFTLTDVLLSFMTVLHVWVLFIESSKVVCLAQGAGLTLRSPKRANAREEKSSP